MINAIISGLAFVAALLVDIETDRHEWIKKGFVSKLNKRLSIVFRVLVFTGIGVLYNGGFDPLRVLAVAVFLAALWWWFFDILLNLRMGFEWNRLGGSAVTDAPFNSWLVQYAFKLAFMIGAYVFAFTILT